MRTFFANCVGASMSFSFRPSAVSVAFGTVSFFMPDHDRTVRVDVSQDVLAKIGGTPPKTKAGFVQLLYRHRKRFAQIAAFKYDEGEFRSEVRVLVVDINEADITRK
jgi:hypothetical protein